MKFLRTVRFDASDSQVFEKTAEPGEWAVPGSFEFLDVESEQLSGKTLQAFNNGFLGIGSFGWSSLVEIAEISDDEYQQVIDQLAQYFIRQHGAPHIAAALPAANDEVHYASEVCEFPLHTLLAIERELGDEGIVESLKVIQRRGAEDHGSIKLWGPDQD
jgi:hypothetical protein